jgi:protein-tyrosine phosphatase
MRKFITLLGGGIGLWWLLRRIHDMRKITYPDALTLIRPIPDHAHDGGERFIPLEGAVNLRDVGGYKTHDGRTVKRGWLYRSAALNTLTPADVDTLTQRGIACVFDLRSIEESTPAPDVLPPNADYIPLPIAMEGGNPFERVFSILFNPSVLQDAVIGLYHGAIVEKSPRLLGTFIQHIAQSDTPALIHCTAGKDRTGVAVALVLSLLGVPDETIIADYTLSNRHYAHYYDFAQKSVGKMSRLGIRADDLWPLLVCDPAIMESTFSLIRERYGSIEAYVQDVCGVPAESITQLREKFLAE